MRPHRQEVAMNRKRLSILACAFLACLPPAALCALSGQVVYTEGDVSVRSGSQTHDAVLGEPINPGDIISTGAESLAVIDLANSTTLKLRPKTTLAIDSLGETTTVTLNAGGVFTHVLKKLTGRFSVQTQTAVAGVRGTEFFIAYGRTVDALPDVWLCVNSGAVDVSLPLTGQSVVVKEGFGINIVAGAKLTTPRNYPWTRRLNWNMDAAAGAVVDTTNLDEAYSDLLNQDYH
jgi:ferric-dicitrate binding protein FerR (iron transport regulator)